MSASYAAQVSPHVTMSTRFGVNIYSYDSDFAIGGEWWVGRRGNRRAEIELSPEARLQIAKHAAIGGRLRDDPEERVVQTISSGRSVEESVREAVAEGVAEATGEAEGKARRDIARAFERQKALERERALLTGDEAQIAAQRRRDAPVAADPNERDGVLKARLSGNWSLALLYEARIRKCLVSVGLVSDVFGGAGRAIRGVGLEVQYLS